MHFLLEKVDFQAVRLVYQRVVPTRRDWPLDFLVDRKKCQKHEVFERWIFCCWESSSTRFVNDNCRKAWFTNVSLLGLPPEEWH